MLQKNILCTCSTPQTYITHTKHWEGCPQQKHWNAKLIFEQCQTNVFDSEIILFSKSHDKF